VRHKIVMQNDGRALIVSQDEQLMTTSEGKKGRMRLTRNFCGCMTVDSYTGYTWALIMHLVETCAARLPLGVRERAKRHDFGGQAPHKRRK